jgi:auxin influx carrier (AUX1 LAX family)
MDKLLLSNIVISGWLIVVSAASGRLEAMWKPKNYKYAYVFCVLYTYLLTIPNSTSVYWAYGDILLHNSNAFGVLPPSMARNVSIIAMIAHQVHILTFLFSD